MKKIFILLGVFLFFITKIWCTSLEILDKSDIKISSHRSSIKLPNQNELQQRIDMVMTDSTFDIVMQLSSSLASSPKEPLWIIMAVNYAFDYYHEKMKNRPSIPKIPGLKFKLMREILRDHPKAIRDLEEAGILNKYEDIIERKIIKN